MSFNINTESFLKENYFLFKFSRLSNRSQNKLFDILNNELNLENFLNTISDKSYMTLYFSSIESESLLEIERLNRDILGYIKFLGDIPKSLNHFDFNALTLNHHFNLPFQKTSPLRRANGKTAVFKLLNLLLDDEHVFDGITKVYFKLNFPLKIKSRKQSLSEIALLFNVTTERIRQYFLQLDEALYTPFLFLNTLKVGILNDYNIEDNLNLISINSSISDLINSEEDTDFTNGFIGLIFGLLLENTHELFLYRDSRNKKLLKNVLLIKKSVVKEFDFQKLINVTVALLRNRVERSYRINLESYLLQFLHTGRLLNGDIKDIAILILKQEFGLEIIEEDFVIERTTGLKNWEYVAIALNDMGVAREGQHIDKIVEYLQERFPDKKFNESGLKPSILTQKDVFISFGKTSSYGLKLWESQYDHVKGGTIVDMCMNLLKTSGNPLHLHELYLFVKQFRSKTYKNSLIGILSSPAVLAKGDLFVYNSYIGLRSQGHHLLTNDIKEIHGTLFRNATLGRFHQYNKTAFIDYFKSLGYKDIQIESILYDKVANGDFDISDQGILIINEFKSNEVKDHRLEVINRTPIESEDEKEQNRIIEVIESKYSQLELVEKLYKLEFSDEDDVQLEHITRVKRANNIIAIIKVLRGFECQICGMVIKKKGGGFYIEAAHIIPKYQGGKESIGNILILCPNHHKEFDYGELSIMKHTNDEVKFFLNDTEYILSLKIGTSL